MRRLINVSNRLPVTVEAGRISKSSGGLVAALEGLDANELEQKWIGWPGGEIGAEKREQVQRTLREEHGCSPVFLSANEVEQFYEGFSNSSLWPLLHYMPGRFKFEPGWWEAYRDVNRKFCDAVMTVAQPGDLVWVHDYQLMLLPAMLRQREPSLQIGFFLHTPFPSFEVFRYHPCRTALVNGIMGADLVGFHTFGYVRHFRSSVLRLQGLEAEMMRIRHDGRETWLGVHPIGINSTRFRDELESAQFRAQLARTAEAHEGMQIVVSVERLDYTKGLLHRLNAIDLFLSRAADRERVKFIMISVPSRENVDDYAQLREEVEWKVGRINGKYATLNDSPIRFIHGSVNFTELAALYAIADVGLVTPLIDGMNLVAKEYVACQRAHDSGVLVLSEFAGAAEELFSALIVNPYDTEALAKAIEQALAMPAEERWRRMEPMRQRVMEADARAWASGFLADLKNRCGHASTAPAAERRDPAEAAGQVRRAIESGRRVALFIDYDGTLREIVRDPRDATPTPAVRKSLDRLRSARNVDVTIISGRSAQDMEAFLGQYSFGLIAEHGAAMRKPGSRDWEQLDRNTDYSWKDELLRVLRLYERSTPGSFVEIKRTSLVWHYRRADPEFGEWKAKHLTEELALMTANEPLHIRHGKKIVEISPSEINKGAAVMRILEQAPKYEVVIVAGDDQTDQSMYRLTVANLISINVGDENGADAMYRVVSPAAFRTLVESAVT